MESISMRKTLVALALALAGTGCGEKDVRELEPPGEVAASSNERLVAQAPSADLARAVEGQNDLAFDLYRKLVRPNANLFLSPVSISTALSMTYAGAAGATADAFGNTLRSNLDPAAHHRAMNDLDARLDARGRGAKSADGRAFRLESINQLFAQTGFGFEVPFLDTLAQEYGANVRLLDFHAQPEPSRTVINDWVEGRTEDRIQDLLPEGSITEYTRLVLVNALYFNAAWKQRFTDALTAPGDFHRADGTTKRVDFMHHGELATRAAQVDAVEVFELPYDGDELSMLVLMPPAGGLDALEAKMSDAVLDGYLAALQGESLTLTFPKFEFRTSAGLREPLGALGLEIAFGEQADFSAMSTQAHLEISDVVHQAFVKVNEGGTEAAAATAVVVGTTSLPQTRQVRVDRPFLFAIRDHQTGALVFLGRVTDP